MTNRPWKHSAVFCIVLAAGVQLVHAQGTASSPTIFNRITKEEIELLLKDVATSNPMALKRLAEDPEMKKQQLDSLKQLLAFASQAQRDGLTDNPTYRQELENIGSEVIAVNYDREINAGKGPMPPLGFISDARVNAFWTASGTAKARQGEFEKFLHSKLEMLKANAPQMADRELTEEEKVQAKDFFAKIKIYEAEYKAKRQTLPKELRDKVDLQTKLQQAQFLARLYSTRLAEKVKVTEDEVKKYISGHPELDSSKQKAKAEQILARAKNGEDFAKLANEFSEDPGNKGANGQLQGGSYLDVPVGRMVAPFERAALALQPGEVSPAVVETDFGYHIIKLEKKGPSPDDAKAEVYDVRHILISTAVEDPDSPTGGDRPVKEYVRGKLENEKEKQMIDEILTANNIQVPEDFTIPVVSEKAPAVKKAPTPKKKRPVRKRR